MGLGHCQMEHLLPCGKLLPGGRLYSMQEYRRMVRARTSGKPVDVRSSLRIWEEWASTCWVAKILYYSNQECAVEDLPGVLEELIQLLEALKGYQLLKRYSPCAFPKARAW